MLARVASKEEAAARVAAEREEERKALARQKDEELDSLRRVAEQQKAEALEAARQAHSEAANAQRLEAEALLARRPSPPPKRGAPQEPEAEVECPICVSLFCEPVSPRTSLAYAMPWGHKWRQATF